jgi:hypothetical protein
MQCGKFICEFFLGRKAPLISVTIIGSGNANGNDNGNANGNGNGSGNLLKSAILGMASAKSPLLGG